MKMVESKVKEDIRVFIESVEQLEVIEKVMSMVVVEDWANKIIFWLD